MNDGSAADWVAAVGTWVIGIGATWYAREAHRQRISEEEIADRSDIRRRNAAFNGIILRLHRAKLLTALYANISPNESVSKLSADELEMAVFLLRRAACSIRWTADELQLLSGDSQVELGKVDNYMNSIEALLDLAIRDLNAGKLEEYYERHEIIREICNDISLVCDVAQPLLLDEQLASQRR